jgi:ribonuclease D
VVLDVYSIGSELEAWGARPWQIDATAQVILDAFVEALQSPEQPDEAVS